LVNRLTVICQLCAADDAKGPIIYKMNQKDMFELLDNTLSYSE